MYIDEAVELKFLGRGGAFLPTEGNTSAYIKDEGILYLFDCGETVFSKIMEKELLSDVKEIRVFISHLHADHVGSLSTLIYYCFYKLKMVLHVYCLDTKILTLLEIQGHLGKEFIFHDLSEKEPYEYHIINDDFAFMYNKTYHGSMLASSFTIYYKSNTIFYSGDSALKSKEWINVLLVQEQAKALYLDTSLYSNEEMHASIHTLANHISPEFRDRVWCMHLDSLELINIAKEYGFNVVEVE